MDAERDLLPWVFADNDPQRSMEEWDPGSRAGDGNSIPSMEKSEPPSPTESERLVASLMKWDPPGWWVVDNNPDTPETITAAYVRAKSCTVCLNGHWPIEDVELELAELLSSTGTGCAGCLILCGIWKSCMSTQRLLPPRSRDFAQWKKGQSRWNLRFLVTSFEVYTMTSPIENNKLPVKRSLDLATLYPWRIPQLPCELEVSLNTGSEHAVKRTLAWIRDCEDNHEVCRGAIPTLPTRVVLIQGLHNVKLYESIGEYRHYVCLSHCWGGGSVTKTETFSLDRYKQGIPWEELPQTFQDAISFTFRLGFRYLWIDSLCILQNSVEDWRSESSRMSQIYSGAYLTIAATAADCSSAGCFRQTLERPLAKHSYPDVDGSKLEVCIRSEADHKTWQKGELPLLRRGWTLQECLLSRRTIHFTDGELIWGCRTETTCECSLLNEAMYLKNMRSPKHMTETTSTSQAKISRSWHRIVQQYSRLNLTFEKDIFPALQGISKQCYQYHKSPYIAGLWESSITFDLLWYVARTTETTRPRQWRAPSWSWASIVGRVDWFHVPAPTPRAIYIKANILPAGTDEFGELLSAKITLMGPCLHEDAEGTYLYTTDLGCSIVYPYHPTWTEEYLSVFLDCQLIGSHSTRPHSTPMVSGQCVKTLLVGENTRHKIVSSWFLILRSVNTVSNAYERIGIMMYTHALAIGPPLGEEETLHII